MKEKFNLFLCFNDILFRCLYDKYDYVRAHEELEDRSTLKVRRIPSRENRRGRAQVEQDA